MTRFIPVLGFLGLVGLLAFMLVTNKGPNDNGIKVLPALQLTHIDTKAAWKPESLNGKLTVFNVFASWCTPCAAEMPELIALKKQFPQIEVQGIAWNDEPVTLKLWLKKHGNPFNNVWLDVKGESTIALGIRGVPETLIVDGAGNIRYRHSGPVTKPLLEKEIAPLITQLLEKPSEK